ncbi:MAG: hypothetical protein M1816_000168 [Peltula sp. TS41687]|nr:MAG: hypothetical protein M1816_000168 [Peltula sp. TS41687]
MAEAFALISLAASIVQLVDFGYKLLSSSKEIYNSVHGSKDENFELELIVEDIKNLNKEASKVALRSKDEVALRRLADESEKLADDLLGTLKKLRARDDVWSNKFESIRVATQSLWKRKDIQSLEERLHRIEERLRARLSNMLQKNQYSTIVSAIQDLTRRNEEMEIRSLSNLDQLRSSLAEATEKQGQATTSLNDLSLKLLLLVEGATKLEKQQKVIDSLCFKSLKKRQDDIVDVHKETLRWIFDKSHTTFTKWLESENGIYWINGQAGSGKSTLMKFICDHERTKQTLQTWAGQEQLYTASYFFWNSGKYMQKSQLGLLQSLLYHVLRSNPELVSSICDDHNGSEPWDVAELLKVFGRLADQTSLRARFCYFVDGLDEYDGREEDIIDVLKQLAASPHIKLCVSSRPWPAFETHFSQSGRMLIVEDLTMDDMKEYVKNELAEDDRFKELAEEDPRCYDIGPQIVERAQGVWLWVYLAVRDLLEDLRDKETYKHLVTRLNGFPRELKAYFADIMKRIDPIYQEETAQILLISAEAVRPLPVLALTFLASQSEDPDYALNAGVEPIEDDAASKIYQTWRTKLKKRCRDLIKVNFDHSEISFFKYKVDFLHRTVRDFLRDNHQTELCKQTSQAFDAKVSLCRMMLALLKRLPVGSKFWDKFYLIFNLVHDCMCYEYYLENCDNPQPQFALLDEVDRVGTLYGKPGRIPLTHEPDLTTHERRGLDASNKTITSRPSSFVALAVEAHLRLYVEHKLTSDPSLLAPRAGRPLLDYALRPRKSMPAATPYRSQDEYLFIDNEMVTTLLNRGADPNQKIKIFDGKTTWGLFLRSCLDRYRVWSPANRDTWYEAAMLLIERGADPDLHIVIPGYKFPMNTTTDVTILRKDGTVDKEGRNNGSTTVSVPNASNQSYAL